jgi:lipopolysaccharide transport system permease protein
MTVAATDRLLSAPAPATPPTVVIEPRGGGLRLGLAEMWGYRELLYFLVWKEVKVRYKQTAIGVAWAVLQPLLTMAIFTVVFAYFARIPSDGLPYPVFAYAALLPWLYFAQSIQQGGTSLVRNANLIGKIYFPRLLLPLSAALTPLVDFAVAFVLLVLLMAWYGIAPTAAVVVLPLFLLLAFLTALAVSLWLAPLNVRYRDVGHTLPFLVQVWMYASPVAYPASLVPEPWRWVYGLNPMLGVIEGFRWALLGQGSPDWKVMGLSAAAVAALLLGGIAHFNRAERTLADIA